MVDGERFISPESSSKHRPNFGARGHLLENLLSLVTLENKGTWLHKARTILCKYPLYCCGKIFWETKTRGKKKKLKTEGKNYWKTFIITYWKRWILISQNSLFCETTCKKPQKTHQNTLFPPELLLGFINIGPLKNKFACRNNVRKRGGVGGTYKNLLL